MSNPRVSGLTLMALSIAAFVGTTSNMLPSVTFFPALALFGAGAMKFLRSNHDALEKAEKRTERALNPVLHENKQARARAERMARRQGVDLDHSGAQESSSSQGPSISKTAIAPREMIEIDDQTDDFVVTTDVSFPAAVQAGDALADQLQKLNQLLEQGVLTAEEYAVAKAKILS